MRTSIPFHPRSQHGDNPYPTHKNRPKNWPKTQAQLLNALSHTQRALEFRLEEEVKALLQANFDENPLKYWDKDKSYTDIQLKEAHSIVRVKPMRYNQADELEFKAQLKNSKRNSSLLKAQRKTKVLIVAQPSWLIIILNKNEESPEWLSTING